MESLGGANGGFATNFASCRSAPLRIPPGGAYGLHCMSLKDSSILSWIVEFIVEFIVELEFVQVQNCSVRICSTMTLINWFSDELTYCWVKIWPIGFWWIDHLLKVYHCWSGICFDRPVTEQWPPDYPIAKWWANAEFHPVRSDKIRARILDLGSGAARRALQNLCPKSARILSAAITRTILLPQGLGDSWRLPLAFRISLVSKQ